VLESIGMRWRLLGMMVVAACQSTSSSTTTDGGASDASGSSLDASGPSVAEATACSGDGQCVLVQTGCCGCCAIDYAAINRDAGRYPEPPCNRAPPPCPPPPPDNVAPQVEPFCVAGQCTPVDIRGDAISACAVDDDCMLRLPDCCGCGQGAPYQAIAIAKSKEAEYKTKICSGTESCGACTATFSEYRVACNQSTKHCQAIALLPDGGDRPF
jgi:hypothetical protein